MSDSLISKLLAERASILAGDCVDATLADARLIGTPTGCLWHGSPGTELSSVLKCSKVVCCSTLVRTLSDVFQTFASKMITPMMCQYGHYIIKPKASWLCVWIQVRQPAHWLINQLMMDTAFFCFKLTQIGSKSPNTKNFNLEIGGVLLLSASVFSRVRRLPLRWQGNGNN